ncbi:MAG: PAS domain S-box protein [Acidobacteriota bacterium]
MSSSARFPERRSRAETTLAAEPSQPELTLDDSSTLRDFVEKIAEGIYVTTPEGDILDGNPALLKIFGAASLEELQQRRAQELFVDPERREEENRLLADHHTVRNFEFQIRRIDGEIRTVRDAVYGRRDDRGKVIAYHGILVDVTEEKRAEEALRETEEKYRAIFENAQDVVYQTDIDGHITAISPAVERYLGTAREELIGRSIEELYLEPEDRRELRSKLLAEAEVTDYEIQLRLKNGEVVCASLNAHTVRDAEGRTVGFAGSLRDITERKELERRLEELSYRDPLTGCYNRRHLDRLRARLQRPTAAWGCLVFDLDNFKQVNDTYGHEEGDRVLQGIVHFVSRHGRAEDVLVRLGGDEFAMILLASSQQEVKSIAQRLLEVAPYESPAAFSLGLAYRRPGETVEDVIAHADRDMYEAKGRGLKPPARS